VALKDFDRVFTTGEFLPRLIFNANNTLALDQHIHSQSIGYYQNSVAIGENEVAGVRYVSPRFAIEPHGNLIL
jgi:hypothetical protein